MSKAKDYSSQSFSPSSGSGGRTKSQPTGDKVDSSGKSREKDDMVGLNDKFVRLIDKVCKSQRFVYLLTPSAPAYYLSHH